VTYDLGRGHSAPSPRPPTGDLDTATIEDHVARIEISHDGKVIASGRAWLVGQWAVPDRIRTDDSYRRRGWAGT
jgi:hypothetical protein